MDLSSLATSLQTSTRLTKAEKDLMEKFRGASRLPPLSLAALAPCSGGGRRLAWPAPARQHRFEPPRSSRPPVGLATCTS